MYEIMLALHLLFAIFTIGPLVHATTTASRGLRRGDAQDVQASARMTRIYAYASVLVVLFGFALMSATSPYTNQAVARFGETWIWLSLLLWLVAVALALALVAPSLVRAAEQLAAGGDARTMTPRIAASGGAIGLLLAVIVFLMVYRPGA